MTNSYYVPTGTPATGAFAASAPVRSEFSMIGAGFDLLPALSAGAASRAVVIASNGLSITTTTGTLALAGNLATTGAFATTLVAGANVSLTLPTVSGTLATLAGTETLTNKTLTAPILASAALGTPASGTLTNCTGYAASALSGTLAVANGGTGVTASTGSGSVVLSASPTFTGTVTVNGGGSFGYPLLVSMGAAGGGGRIVTTGSHNPDFQMYDTTAGGFGIFANGSDSGRLNVYSVTSAGTFSATLLTLGASGMSLPNALTYGGVTLSNAVTGTGAMVLSASPTVTGTLTAAVANFSGLVTVTADSSPLIVSNRNNATTSKGAIQFQRQGVAKAEFGTDVNGNGTGLSTFYWYDNAGSSTLATLGSGGLTLPVALTYGGVTLSNAVTGTGNMVLSASPTFTGTLTAAAASFSGAVALGNTVNAVSPTSPNRTVTIDIGGTTYYLAAKTTND